MNLARTVGRGNVELRASSGGPLVQVGQAVFPTPQLRVGARWGATDDVDVMGHLAIDALVSGIGALDVGVVGQMVRERGGLAMSLSARLHAIVDLDDAVTPRVFPEVGLHLEHPLDRSALLFFGLAGAAQIEPPRLRPFLFVSPYLGLEMRFDPVRGADGTPREETALALQVGWINPWETATGVVRYVPDGAGALTVVLALRHRFGGIER
ncbi:MAG: hypothetical protein OHK0013_31520 [Sandaracinaceae bacterium]